MRAYLIAAAVLTAVVVIFSLQNGQPVSISFFGFLLEGPLALVIILTLAVGMISGYLLSIPARIRRGRELADCRKLLQTLEKRHGLR